MPVVNIADIAIVAGADSVVQTADGGYALASYTVSVGAGFSDIWLAKTDVESGLAWTDSALNSIIALVRSIGCYINFFVCSLESSAGQTQVHPFSEIDWMDLAYEPSQFCDFSAFPCFICDMKQCFTKFNYDLIIYVVPLKSQLLLFLSETFGEKASDQ
jgi:hypothetical protein